MPFQGQKSTFRSLGIACAVVFVVALGFFTQNSASAAVPREINYQSRLRSSSLAPITTATNIQFSIYSSPSLGAYTDSAASSGPLLWKGVYNGGACPQITPDADGYFAVQLGSSCSPFPSYIDWNQTLYLGVRIGADAEATPRVQISAYPYALNAETIDTFSASSTAAANTLLALDQNLNFNILTGGFLGGYFSMSSSTVTSTIAGHFDVQGNTTLGSSSADLITVNGRFNTDLVPALDLAYSLGTDTNRWNGVFGTVTTTNLNVLGNSNFTNITWVNATGTNTTSTNLFATNAGATYINFSSATGVSLNLSNTLYINTIAINSTGTTSTDSGAWLIGVFDEFAFSNSTNVQDVLDDLDTQLSIAAATDTLQTVTAAGNTTTLPIYVQNTSTFRDILPEAHNLYTLGSTTTRWAELFATTVYVGSSTWAFAQNTSSGLTISGPSGQQRVLVTNTGNMALNTTSTPTARLEVQSSGVSNQMIRARNSTGNVVFDISQDILANAQMLYNNRLGVNLAILQTQGSGGSFSLRDTNGLTRVLLRGDSGASSYIDALNFGLGVTGPIAKLHVSSSDPFDLPIVRFNNASGDIDLYSVTTTPEGAVFGGFGDLAVDSVSGYLYIKETTDATSTGWARVATGTLATTATTTLDSAYRQGGAGVSRVITIDGGSVEGRYNTSTLINGFSGPIFSGAFSSTTNIGFDFGVYQAPGQYGSFFTFTGDRANFFTATNTSFIAHNIVNGSLNIGNIGGSNIFIGRTTYELNGNDSGIRIQSNTSTVDINGYTGLDLDATNGRVNITANNNGDYQTGSIWLEYNSSTGQGLRLVNNSVGSYASINVNSSDPEGMLYADVGSLYLRPLAGASGTLAYLKSTSATTTGWVGIATVDMLGSITTSTSSSLQIAYDGGNDINAVLGNAVSIFSPTNTSAFLQYNPGLVVGGDGTGINATSNGFSVGKFTLSGNDAAVLKLGQNVDRIDAGDYASILYYNLGGPVASFALTDGDTGPTDVGRMIISNSGATIEHTSATVQLLGAANGAGNAAVLLSTNTTGDVNLVRLTQNGAVASVTVGSGSPESSFTASVGSIYFNPSATASGTIAYLKTTNSTSTGWIGIATVDMLGSITTSTETLHTVTSRGNSTTNTIQFAGGTSTGVVAITGVGTSTISNNLQISGKAAIGSQAGIDTQSVFPGYNAKAALVISETYSGTLFSTTDQVTGIQNYIQANPSTAGSAAVFAMDNEVVIPNTASDFAGNIAGAYNSVYSEQASTSSQPIFGIWNEVIHQGTGYMDRAFANQSVVYNQATGTIRSAIAHQASIQNNGVGRIVDAIGVAILAANNSGGGILENTKGLLLQDQSLAGATVSHYNLLSEGSNSYNQFEGSVKIGSGYGTSSRLHVNSGAATIVPIFTLQNSSNDVQLFNATGSPEGVITGSIGDLAFDPVFGRLFIKQSGTSTNTGWVAFATGTASEVDTLQTVTARGNTTTLPIYVQNTSTFRDIIPETHNLYSLGTTTTRWKELYAVTTYVGSSTWALEQATNAGFSIRNAANLNDSIRVNPNGDVGIGTSDQGTAPQARLHVLGGSVLMGGNLGEEIFLLDPVANTVSIGDYSGWNSNTFIRVDDNTARIIMPNGFVGIGTSTPATRLDLLASSASTTPIMTVGNAAGDYQLFNIQADPNGVITGSRGDLAVDSTSGRLYIKEIGDGTNTGWVAFATGTAAEADTLQTVTNRGNTTTNSIEVIRPLIEGDATRTPYIVLRDTTTTDQGLVLARYNSGGGSDTNSLIAFTSDISDPNSATSVVLDYGHLNNYLNMQVFDGGTFQSSFALGQVMQFTSMLDRGLGPDSSISITNSGSIRGFLGISNPQTAIDFFLATGTPEGIETANSGSLWFNHAATSSPYLYIKTTDGPSTGWVGLATLNDLASSTATNTLQTVTARGNTTTLPIYIQNTSTFRDIIPESHNTYSLGSTTTRWAQLFAGIVNVGTSTWSLAQSAGQRFSIFDGGSGTGNERFSISATSGNVGIGTVNPTSKLYVNVGNGDGITVRATNNAYLAVGTSDTNEWKLASDGTAPNRFDLMYNGASFIAVSSTGGVAIGTVPYTSNRLSVNGSLAVGGTGYSTVNAPANGLIVQGNVGFGTSTPATKLHLLSTSNQAVGILTVENPVGNFQIFNASTTPEGLIAGSQGDLTVDSTNGRLYLKETGAGTNTGWVSIATGTIPSTSSFFQQNGNSFGGTATLGTNDSNSLAFETLNQPRVTIGTGGHVSIASASSGAPTLTVNAAGDSSGIRLAGTSDTIYRQQGGGTDVFTIRTAGSDTYMNALTGFNLHLGANGGTTQSDFTISSANIVQSNREFRVNNTLTGSGTARIGQRISSATNSGNQSGDTTQLYVAPDDGGLNSTGLNIGLDVTLASLSGGTNLAARFNSGATNTQAIMTIANTGGDFQLFRVDAVPNGNTTGSIGDLAIDSTNGRMYIKETGANTLTGWSAFVTSTSAAESDTFQTVTNRGNTTTNAIQFAGGTSTGVFYAQTRIGVGTSTGSIATRLALQSSSTNSEIFRVYGTSFQPILGLAEDVLGNGQFILRDSAGNTRIDFYGASNGIMNMYDSAGNVDFGFLADNDSYINTGANFGIGTTLPSSTLHIFSESATSGRSIMTIGRFNADFQTFVVTSTPEGLVYGSAGDLAVDSVFGRLFIKETGTSTNTGWVQVATGTNSADTFQTVTARGNTTTLPIYVQNTSTFRDILPEAGLTYNLGASTSRWNSLWTATMNVGTSTWSLTTKDSDRFTINSNPDGAGIEAFSILRSGNVGIGNTNPTNRLSVGDGSTSIQRIDINGGVQSLIEFKEAGTNRFMLASNDISGAFGLYNFADTRYNFLVGSTGNVVIGGDNINPFATAARTLTLSGAVNQSAAINIRTTQSDASGNTTVLNFLSEANTGAADERMAALRVVTTGTSANNRGSDLEFYTKPNAGSLSRSMLINAAGLVSVGQIDSRGTSIFNILGGDTVGKNAYLTIDAVDGSGGGYGAGITMNSDFLGGGGGPFINFNENGNLKGTISTETGTGLTITTGTSTAESIFFRTNSLERVAIGPTGTVRFAAYGAGTLTTDASGNITASSDERLKNKEADFTRGLDAIKGLSPMTYHWKAETGLDTTSTYAGFSAQNVRDFIPEAVDIDPRGYYSLSDRPIIAALVNAVKELDLRVSDAPETFMATSSVFVSTSTFEGAIVVKERMNLGSDTVGQAKMLSGATLLRVRFEDPYDKQPIVNITPVGLRSIDYGVENITTEGFDIAMRPEQTEAILFNWIAFGAEEGIVTVSDGTTSTIEIIVGGPPVPPSSDTGIEPPLEVSEPTVPMDEPTASTSTDPAPVAEPEPEPVAEPIIEPAPELEPVVEPVPEPAPAPEPEV